MSERRRPNPRERHRREQEAREARHAREDAARFRRQHGLPEPEDPPEAGQEGGGQDQDETDQQQQRQELRQMMTELARRVQQVDEGRQQQGDQQQGERQQESDAAASLGEWMQRLEHKIDRIEARQVEMPQEIVEALLGGN